MDLVGKGRCLTKIVTKKLREGKTYFRRLDFTSCQYSDHEVISHLQNKIVLQRRSRL